MKNSIPRISSITAFIAILVAAGISGCTHKCNCDTAVINADTIHVNYIQADVLVAPDNPDDNDSTPTMGPECCTDAYTPAISATQPAGGWGSGDSRVAKVAFDIVPGTGPDMSWGYKFAAGTKIIDIMFAPTDVFSGSEYTVVGVVSLVPGKDDMVCQRLEGTGRTEPFTTVNISVYEAALAGAGEPKGKGTLVSTDPISVN